MVWLLKISIICLRPPDLHWRSWIKALMIIILFDYTLWLYPDYTLWLWSYTFWGSLWYVLIRSVNKRLSKASTRWDDRRARGGQCVAECMAYSLRSPLSSFWSSFRSSLKCVLIILQSKSRVLASVERRFTGVSITSSINRKELVKKQTFAAIKRGLLKGLLKASVTKVTAVWMPLRCFFCFPQWQSGL